MQKWVDEAAFSAALASLNPAQRQAVETIEGPVMVIAGPGTGKTQILTLRIATILKQTDTKPEQVLALTFTESGAAAMRARLCRYIGTTAYRVPIYTFHGFAERLIKTYPDAFPRLIGGRSITDVEKVALLERILETPTLTILRPLGNHTYYVPYLISMIGHLKQEYITPDRLTEIIDSQEQTLTTIEQYHTKGAHKGKVRGEYTELLKTIAKNRELEHVYRQYEAALRAEGKYDFDDMIKEAVVALTNDEEMLRDLQETYQYILADEHQDVNGAQNKIIELLTNFHDSPNIFVVGDEKQAIYRFQGASLENFLYFMDVFPTTKQIALTQNYRSGPEILKVAEAVITVPDETIMKLRVPLTAAAVAKAEVRRLDFSHQAVEDDWLIKTVKAELASGVVPNEIAVILRTNREVEAMAERLRQAGIPVKASADGDVLTHPITQAVEALINYVLTDTDEKALFTVMHGAYWGISTDDLVKIAAARSFDRSLISILSDRELLKELGVQAVESAYRVSEVLTAARALEVTDAPHRVLQYLLEASGFLHHVMKYDPFEGVRVIRRIYDEIEAMVIRDGVGTLREVNATIALRRRYGLPLTAPFISTNTVAVEVMTAHKSKGLEFEVVFVPHLNDANWGGRKGRTMFKVPLTRYQTSDIEAESDDERRLLYVAITRAKRKLYLSTAAESSLGKAVNVSRLIAGLTDEAVIPVEVTQFEADFSPATALSFQVSQPISKELLCTLVAERGLSATSLNNLLKNPWDFFYRNLLRIPEAQALHLQFGTAIHSVLQSATAKHTKGQGWVSPTEIKTLLESALRRLPLSVSEYTRLHERGFPMLCVFVEHLKQTLDTSVTREEVSLRAELETELPDLPTLALTGKIDRIDYDADGRALRVVDYKTGKKKSRAAISGTTKSSDGAYRRQLTFYALLMSLGTDDRLSETREGTLSFVEPAQNGSITEETFIISNDEIKSLRDELIQAVSSFIQGAFLTDTALAETSSYKDLALALIDRTRTSP
jgi:DNA helicase-2/ATP-dependent DNA helicase PcrA